MAWWRELRFWGDLGDMFPKPGEKTHDIVEIAD